MEEGIKQVDFAASGLPPSTSPSLSDLLPYFVSHLLLCGNRSLCSLSFRAVQVTVIKITPACSIQQAQGNCMREYVLKLCVVRMRLPVVVKKI